MGCSCSGCPEEEVAASVMVSIEVPGGVTIGGGATATEPPPQPARPRNRQRIAETKTPQSAKRRPFARANAQRFLTSNRRRTASASSGSRRVAETGGTRRGTYGGKIAEPLVFTVTLKVVEVPLVSETVEGTWQIALRGAPLQASETEPLKPCPGVS